MITKIELPAGTTEEQEMRLRFDNGDLQALKDVIEKYGFIDAQSALRFALFVLLKNEAEGVYIEESGNRIFLTPSKTLLKEDRSAKA